jgi:tetratricopeptide (TPR) repeat protein
LTLLAFGNSFSTGFPLDSKGLILQDPRVHEATRQNIDLIFGHSYWWARGSSGLYRPVTTLSYLFNYAVLGNAGNPAGYHWINFLLHLGNVLLVYGLALKLIRRFWPAVMLAAVWSVHPLLTESVTNIAGRPDLLAAMAVLAGFLLYLKSAEAPGGARMAWLAALAAVSAIGVFSKENAAVLAGVIVLYELLWWRNRRVPLILGCVAVLLPLQVMLYQRSVVLAAEAPAAFPFTDNPLVGAGFWQAKLTAVKVMARYLGLTIWPANLSADYSYNAIPLSNGGAADWISWFVVGAAVAGSFLLYRRNRTAFFLAAFAFLTFLPTSNLLFPLGTIMAERFLYLPAIGLLGCLVLAVFRAAGRFRKPVLAPAILGILICGFGLRTFARNSDWRDDLTLARSAVEACPGSFKTHKMVAEALYNSDDSHSNFNAVLEEAEKGIAILDPLPDSRNSPELYRLAGECYLTRGDRLHSASGGSGDSAKSLEAYRKSLPLIQRGIAILDTARQEQVRLMRAHHFVDPHPEASVNDDLYRLLSMAYFRLGDGDKAFDAIIEARKRTAMNPAVYSQLGHILFGARQPADAATAVMEGMLVTSDLGLRQELIELYRTGFPGSECALVTGPNGEAINPSCALVHKNLCDSSVDAIRIRLQTGRRDLAADLRRSFVNDYGCPAGPLDQAMAQAASK